jgi:hypothetical protein
MAAHLIASIFIIFILILSIPILSIRHNLGIARRGVMKEIA